MCGFKEIANTLHACKHAQQLFNIEIALSKYVVGHNNSEDFSSDFSVNDELFLKGYSNYFFRTKLRERSNDLSLSSFLCDYRLLQIHKDIFSSINHSLTCLTHTKLNFFEENTHPTTW